jgi:hypothetical protein
MGYKGLQENYEEFIVVFLFLKVRNEGLKVWDVGVHSFEVVMFPSMDFFVTICFH